MGPTILGDVPTHTIANGHAMIDLVNVVGVINDNRSPPSSLS